MFEKHGQHIISSIILAGILYVITSVNSLEKQAILWSSSHLWTAIASSAVTGILTLGEALGYMSTDWTCIVLLVVLAGLGVATYYLRLDTHRPIEKTKEKQV